MENVKDKISEKIGRHFMFIVALPPPHPLNAIIWKMVQSGGGHRW